MPSIAASDTILGTNPKFII